ncbi:MAG: hypothetical protein LBI94_08225, partial [Treponema sp.]|nr:hypothetical protein [Treponema sp.]
YKITGGPVGWKNPGPPPQILSTATPCYILRASFLPLKKLTLLNKGVNQGKKCLNCRVFSFNTVFTEAIYPFLGWTRGLFSLKIKLLFWNWLYFFSFSFYSIVG